MAEIAGVAISVITLAGLFNNAVDCFNYIQQGEDFHHNYRTQLLRLDIAEVRLSRWGEALGLGPEGESADEDPATQRTIPKAEADMAEDILNQIIELFDAAEKASKRLKTTDTQLAGDTVETIETRTSVSKKLRMLALGRRGLKDLKQKTYWALKGSQRLIPLVDNISGLVADLIDLFPNTRDAQKKLCREEVSSQLFDDEEVCILKDIAEGQDDLLASAIQERLQGPENQKSSTNVSLNIVGGQHSGLNLAQNSGNISGLRWGGSQ